MTEVLIENGGTATTTDDPSCTHVVRQIFKPNFIVSQGFSKNFCEINSLFMFVVQNLYESFVY